MKYPILIKSEKSNLNYYLINMTNKMGVDDLYYFLYHFKNFDVNFLDDNGVNLLIKISANSSSKPYINFTLKDFEEHGDELLNKYSQSLNNINATDICAILYFLGSDPWIKNNNGDYFLDCFCDNKYLLELFMNHKNAPSIDELNNIIVDRYNNNNILFKAVKENNEEVVSYLIKIGVDVNFKNQNGETPLFFVNNEKILNFLLEAGADLNIKNNSKKNCLEAWSNSHKTSQLKISLNRLAFNNLKKNKTIEELQDFQKPLLLKELRSGTKTNFISTFNKLKYPKNITFENENYNSNILTEAILRYDEKSCSIIKDFDEEELWLFKIKGSLNNLVLASLMNDFSDGYRKRLLVYDNFLKEKIKNNYSESQLDEMYYDLSLILSKNNFFSNIDGYSAQNKLFEISIFCIHNLSKNLNDEKLSIINDLFINIILNQRFNNNELWDDIFKNLDKYTTNNINQNTHLGNHCIADNIIIRNILYKMNSYIRMDKEKILGNSDLNIILDNNNIFKSNLSNNFFDNLPNNIDKEIIVQIKNIIENKNIYNELDLNQTQFETKRKRKM